MIGIIAAMDAEVAAICELLEHKQDIKVSGISMYKGMIGKQRIMVMKSGVGKGSAAMATTILLENFRVRAIVNIGTAGGLCPQQEILDAVISDRVVQHDMDTSDIDGAAGIGLYFQADTRLSELSAQVLQEQGIRVYRGLVASGDEFIADEKRVQRLLTKFPEAICAEMEAGAIAQVCTHYQLPFVVLRSLSDVVHKENSHMDFLTYVKHASKRSAAFCKALMQKLSEG